ncbi:hypothetical protein NA57DRAFT_77960 [Rhizodiscina lignyota]|uniref:Uncharacterized protein n=1 Tax=Rhizodiscina lignyota TaxID=1504668 RepID=A0A9P4M436_9PEZI|nr:hypothetical protein NA57DRAFT_77960 [Rhizodiscina lignyota]
MALAAPIENTENSTWYMWKYTLNWFLSGRWMSPEPVYPMKLHWEPPWALEGRQPTAVNATRSLSSAAAAAVLESPEVYEEPAESERESMARMEDMLAQCTSVTELKNMLQSYTQKMSQHVPAMKVAQRLILLGATSSDIRTILGLDCVSQMDNDETISLIQTLPSPLLEVQYKAMLSVVRFVIMHLGFNSSQSSLRTLLRLLRKRERSTFETRQPLRFGSEYPINSFLEIVWMALRTYLKRNEQALDPYLFKVLIAELWRTKLGGTRSSQALKLDLFKHTWPELGTLMYTNTEYVSHLAQLLFDTHVKTERNAFTAMHLREAFGILSWSNALRAAKYATLALITTSNSAEQVKRILPQWFRILRDIDKKPSRDSFYAEGWNQWQQGELANLERLAFVALKREYNGQLDQMAPILSAFHPIDAGRLTLHWCLTPHYDQMRINNLVATYRRKVFGYSEINSGSRSSLRLLVAETLVEIALRNFPGASRPMVIILNFMLQVFGAETLVRVLRKLQIRNISISDDAVESVVNFAVRTGQHKLAADIYHCTSARLSHWHEYIIFRLIDGGQVHSRTIFQMLQHCQPPTRVFVDPTAKIREITPERVKLVNDMAQLFAEQKENNVSSRVAFRNVCYCYRYLKGYGAPVSHQLAEAIVTAGAIRPLQRGEWVSTTQFTWVLSFVRRAEGEAVAERLDRLTFKWREQIRLKRLEEANLRRLRGERFVWKTFHHAVPFRTKFGVIPTRRDGWPTRMVTHVYRKRIWVKRGMESTEPEVIKLGKGSGPEGPEYLRSFPPHWRFRPSNRRHAGVGLRLGKDTWGAAQSLRSVYVKPKK